MKLRSISGCTMRLILSFALFSVTICSIVAQGERKWEAGLLLGVSNYQGDLVPTHFFTFKENKLAYGLYVKKYLTSNIGLRLSYNRGNIAGDDANFDIRDERLASFTSPLSEMALRFDFDAPSDQESFFKTGYVPYFFAGIGLANFNPSTKYGLYADSDVSKQWVINDQLQAKSHSAISLPIGVGLKVQTKTALSFSFEIGYRLAFSDYLDGVSETGNPNNNDSYVMGGITIARRFDFSKDSDGDGVSDKKDLCPMMPGLPAFNGCPDTDGDGIVDAEDNCPLLAGSSLAKGCPDRDNDGIKDEDDACPEIAGSAKYNGCPDSDNDGVTDDKDECPQKAGPASLKGCPDGDGDGVADNKDKCPDVAGPVSNDGCPQLKKDTDKDGIPDDEDRCPDQVGLKQFNGCPDTDKDGIADPEDRCPTLAGEIKYKGCPDTDNDGIADPDDKCPNTAGPLTNFGCPEIKKEDKDILDLAVRNVNFESGKAVLTISSYEVLDKILDIMIKYPEYKLSISGYTDNVGKDATNQKLSFERAKSCMNYIVSKGGSKNKISATGFGKLNPVASNNNAEGRSLNRRVEFKLYIE